MGPALRFSFSIQYFSLPTKETEKSKKKKKKKKLLKIFQKIGK